MQIQTEMRSRAQTAREQVLCHLGRSSHVCFDNYVRNDLIMLRARFFFQQALVKAVVHARKLAQLFRGDQVDSFHASRKMLGITQIPPEPEKISSEPLRR